MHPKKLPITLWMSLGIPGLPYPTNRGILSEIEQCGEKDCRDVIYPFRELDFYGRALICKLISSTSGPEFSEIFNAVSKKGFY